MMENVAVNDLEQPPLKMTAYLQLMLERLPALPIPPKNWQQEKLLASEFVTAAVSDRKHTCQISRDHVTMHWARHYVTRVP